MARCFSLSTFLPFDNEAFEVLLVERFEGFTRYRAEATSAWADAGTIYRDVSSVYAVALRSILDVSIVGPGPTRYPAFVEMSASWRRPFNA